MIHAWDVNENLDKILSLYCPRDIAISPDRSKIAWISLESHISLVDINTWNIEYNFHFAHCNKLRFFPDGGDVLISNTRTIFR